MVCTVDRSLLDHLKRLDATLDRVESKVDDLTIRAGSIESGLALIIQHFAHVALTRVSRQIAIDSIGVRLARIEQRLELVG